MKFGEDLNIDIKDYMGRIGPGVITILSIIYKSKPYEGMYWYTDTDSILQFPYEVEEDMGCKIEDHDLYKNIMEFISSKKSNYKELAPKLDDIFSEPPREEGSTTDQKDPDQT